MSGLLRDSPCALRMRLGQNKSHRHGAQLGKGVVPMHMIQGWEGVMGCQVTLRRRGSGRQPATVSDHATAGRLLYVSCRAQASSASSSSSFRLVSVLLPRFAYACNQTHSVACQGSSFLLS